MTFPKPAQSAAYYGYCNIKFSFCASLAQSMRTPDPGVRGATCQGLYHAWDI